MSKHVTKILIAEDDVFLRKVYVTKLNKEGFDVSAASDGEEAMVKLREVKPDLALIDLVMPVMTGFEVLEHMAADKELRSIPVIVVSNLGQASDIKRAEALGAKDYLIKSNSSIAATVEKIRSVLSRSQEGSLTELSEDGVTQTPVNYVLHLKPNFGDYQRLLVDCPWLQTLEKPDLQLTLHHSRGRKFTISFANSEEK